MIDHDRDLMLMVATCPGLASTVKLTNRGRVKPGTELYAVVIAPLEGDKVVLFSKAGLTYKPVIGNLSSQTNQNYLQANFPVGPGASGAPVFLLDRHQLVGILGAQMTDGNAYAPIRATLIIPSKLIQELFEQYMEDKDDSKSDWPYCHGEERICQVLRGEISFVESLRRRALQMSGSEDSADVSESTDEPRGTSVEDAE
jgi:hypothetical protein